MLGGAHHAVSEFSIPMIHNPFFPCILCVPWAHPSASSSQDEWGLLQIGLPDCGGIGLGAAWAPRLFWGGAPPLFCCALAGISSGSYGVAHPAPCFGLCDVIRSFFG